MVILVLLQIDRQMLSLAFRFLRARTPEQRAFVDLETHYTKVSQKHLGSFCSLLVWDCLYIPLHLYH